MGIIIPFYEYHTTVVTFTERQTLPHSCENKKNLNGPYTGRCQRVKETETNSLEEYFLIQQNMGPLESSSSSDREPLVSNLSEMVVDHRAHKAKYARPLLVLQKIN